VIKRAPEVVASLGCNAHAESVTIGGVGLRDARVTMALDVVRQLAITLLPPVTARVPCRASQVFKSAPAIGVKSAFGVVPTLRLLHAVLLYRHGALDLTFVDAINSYGRKLR
jgi:hypothetical protein